MSPVRTEGKSCPRDPSHYTARVTEVIIDGKTVITKECETCGQFISQTILPAARRIDGR